MAVILPPSEQQMAIRAKNARIRQLRERIRIALEDSSDLTMSASDLELIQTKALGREYTRYQENDSPKGDNIPGVCYRQAA